MPLRRLYKGSGERTGDVIMGFANRLMDAQNNQQGLDIEKKKIGIEKEKVGLLDRRVSIEEKLAGPQRELTSAQAARLGVETDAARQKLQVQQRLSSPLGPGDMAQVRASMPLLDEPLGFTFSKSVEPLINRVEALSAQGGTRLTIYNRVKQNWDALNKGLLSDAQKAMEKAVKDGDVATAGKLKLTIDGIADGSIVDALFPQAAQYTKEQAAQREFMLKKTAGSAAGPVTLSPGQKLVDPGTGRLIASGEKKTATMPTFQKKVDALIEQNPGLREQDATNIITGAVKVMQNPVTGEKSLVNLTTGVERPLTSELSDGAGDPSIADGAASGKTIWEAAALGTGPVSAAKAGASRISGVVGGPVAGQTIQARQFIQTAKNELLRALSVNAKMPVAEITRIEREVELEPAVLDNPTSFRNRALAIEDALRIRIRKKKQTANDRSLPVTTRQGARATANAIENFLDILGVPARTTEKNWESTMKTLKSGDQYIDPDGNIRTKQ